MDRDGRRRLQHRIAGALDDEHLQVALRRAMAALSERQAQAFGPSLDFEGLRSQARAMKEEAIARSDELLAQLEERIVAAGGHFVLAATAADARRYIVGLARDRGVRLIVKSKSMTGEEIGLNGALEEAGMEVIETDLGERIIQLAGERPSHLIVPAIHKSREQIVELLGRRMGIEEPPADAAGLTRLVRRDLRQRFLAADMGITGGNTAVAETGTLVLLENEGNIRLTTELPPIHVAVLGLEKVVPRLADVATLLELLPRSATGQLLTAYVSFLGARSSAPVLDTGRATGTPAREFHLVILDNGRRAAARDRELREMLYCIRCGACLNVCAPYRKVGGHVYGADPYPGGIGCVWTYVTAGAREAERINGLCTTCSRCTEVCPTKVDIPWLNTIIRQRRNRQAGAGLRQRVFARPDLLGAAFSPVAPIANWAARTAPARRSFAALGIDHAKPLPRYQRETFLSWYRRRRPASARGASTKALLFVDCFMNHNLPQVGKAAVRVLEALGVDVAVAHTSCCGRPAMSQGLLAAPRRWALHNLRELGPMLERGYDIICLEPSCLSALRDDYARLLEHTEWAGDPRLRLLQQRSYEFCEYVLAGIDLSAAANLPWAHGARSPTRADGAQGSTFLVHGHCHQKSLGIAAAPAELLRTIPGATVHQADALCCGMVGSFGYKEEYSRLSRSIGEELFEQLRACPADVVACGISCRSQIEQGLGRAVSHPAEVLAKAIGTSPDA